MRMRVAWHVGSTETNVCPEITATNEEEMLSYVLGLRYG